MGEEAFAEARRRDVPILLSIGYAACHWCHVMARESFADEQTAQIMNANFVNVKVDREERPDVDAVYMEATQAMTGHGGWPMTVFATPDGEPFYCGTYFPREHFQRLLLGISHAWRTDRTGVVGQGKRVAEALSAPARCLAGRRRARRSWSRRWRGWQPSTTPSTGVRHCPEVPAVPGDGVPAAPPCPGQRRRGDGSAPHGAAHRRGDGARRDL